MYNDSTPIGSQVSTVLIAAINQFPQEWALTPCVGKRNLWPGWQNTKLDRETLTSAIATSTNADGKPCAWTGVSVVTGSLSEGLMAVDFDGPAALQKYVELSAGELPPLTMKWTSGRTDHFQILLQVPRKKWEGLKPQKIELENGNKLELRWNQCSTLPPSIHPDTGKPYFWESKADTLIAECPDFILDLMRGAPTIELPQKPKRENSISTDASEKSLVDILESEILPRLDAEEFYGSYLKLKSAGKNLKALCPFHDEKTPSFSVTPAEKAFHCFGCGAGGGPVQFLHQIKGGSGSPTGKDFYSVVMELADRVGVAMPDRKLPAQNLKSKIPDFQGVETNDQYPKTNNLSNVLIHPRFEVPDPATLESEIEKLFSFDLKRSQLQIKISELAKNYRLPSSDIWKIYREQEQEQEQEADRPDVAAEIEALLSAHKSSIALTEVLPFGLAQPIEKLAAMLNLRSECYLAALLTQVASLFKVGTETILRRDTNWRCVPNYFAGMVAEVSQLKTPVPVAIIDRPMRVLRERAQKEFEQAKADYETELNNWKMAKKEEDRGPAPKEPRERIYAFDKTTGEALIYQQAHFPEQPLMYYCDELAGIFKSANQYRGGKGSDEEDLLSFWNGKGSTVLRAAGVRARVEAMGVSIFGTIQPDVLAGLLKDCSDSNGKFARFDFVLQPLAVPNLPEDDSGRFDLTPMLADLYQKIDALPAICFEFDQEAKTYHRTFTLKCHERRVHRENKQGLRGALGKMPEKVGKLATIIHALTCIFNNQQVTNHIPRSAVEAAAKFVKFTADQVASLYTEFSDRSALAPNLAKILLAAERKGGTITIREARENLFHTKQRPTTQTVREWFSELQEMKYGEVTTVKKSVSFTLTISPTPTRPTVALNPDTERLRLSHSSLKHCPTVPTVDDVTVGQCGTPVGQSIPQSEALSSKVLDTTVGRVGQNSPPSEKSESLLLSYLTEPAEFAEQIRKAIANFDCSLAVQVWKALEGKAKEKLRNEVWDVLAPSETKNFTLLAKTEFLRGTRVKITSDYPGSETLRGIEATVREDLGKRGIDVEFDAEVEIVGGKPRKFLVVSAEFLALIPAAPVPTKKAPTKIKVGDRVALKDVGGRYAGTRGTVSKVLAEDKYYIDYDKAVGSSKFGLWPASELWKLPN